MELEVLKKRLSTYKTDGGYLKNISDEIALEVLKAWEQWTGPAKGFGTAIGTNQHTLANVIKKAKGLKRDGFATDGFKEVKVAESSQAFMASLPPCSGIEMCLEGGKLIRFQQVDQLIDFLKKVA